MSYSFLNKIIAFLCTVMVSLSSIKCIAMEEEDPPKKTQKVLPKQAVITEYFQRKAPTSSESSTEQQEVLAPDQALPSLDISQLSFHENHPTSYSLFHTDTKRYTYNKNPIKRLQGLEAYLTLTITNNPKDFSTAKQLPKKDKWLRIHKDLKVNEANEQTFHTIELLKRNRKRSIGFLMESLTGTSEILLEPIFERSAVLIIFPQTKTQSMVYGLLNWKELLNKQILTPQWGLRMACSEQIGNLDLVHTIKASNYHRGSAYIKQESSIARDPIENFDFEIGTEELAELRLLPLNKIGLSQHLVKGSDYFHWDVQTKSTDQKTSALSLQTIAKHFYDLYTNPHFKLNERISHLLDEEVRDCDLQRVLSQRLAEHMKQTNRLPSFIFLHPSVFRDYGNKTIYFGRQKKPFIQALEDSLKRKNFSLEASIDLRTHKKSRLIHKLKVSELISSLPIEYEDNFYRFERGRWFHVNASRFEAIKKILRTTKVSAETLGLTPYTKEDATKKIEKNDYKESNYNKRTVKDLIDKGIPALLLDRINVDLSGHKNIFEFTDIIFKKDGKLYIVHVKRKEANALSHHREQLERTVDYLSSELNRPGSKDLLLKGVINTLYLQHNISPNKIEGQKGITHWAVFSEPKNLTKESIQSSVNSANKNKEQINVFIDHVLEKTDTDFFKNHLAAFQNGLNTLYECVKDKSEQQQKASIQKGFDAIKQAVQMQETLFPNALPLTKEFRQNIVLVLAIIDDRDIEKTVKKEKGVHKGKKGKKGKQGKQGKRNTQNQETSEIFHKQDLWGLDRTRDLTRKQNFDFKIVVINEKETVNKDVFGSIEYKDQKTVASQNKKESLPSNSPQEKPKKKNRAKSPSPQSSNSSENSEDEDLGEDLHEFQHLIEKADLIQKGDALSTTEVIKLNIEQDSTYPNLPASLTVIPTVGDGDCFFHAIFTEAEEDLNVVRARAKDMRKGLCNAIQGGEYIEDCKLLLLEHYRGDKTTAPEEIQKMLNDPNASQEAILAQIPENTVKNYMRNLRTSCVRNSETYITFRQDMKCPAQIIVERYNAQQNMQQRKCVRIFTYDDRTSKLILVKEIGSAEQPVINILHHGDHFVRLWDGTEREKPQVEQIYNNKSSSCVFALP